MAAATIGGTILLSGRVAATGARLLSLSSSYSPASVLFAKPSPVPVSSTSLLRFAVNNVDQASLKRKGFLRFCSIGESSTVADSSSLSSVGSAAPASSPPDPSTESGPSEAAEAAGLLDIRVGRILKAWKHPEADSLYVEEVDIGEPESRTICSGLVNYIPLDHLQEKLVVVLANLKPRNMRGVKSCGMLMAASDAPHEKVELLVPPEGSVPGERIWFGSEEDKEKQASAATPNQIQKKKIWESVQPHLKTDASGVAVLGERPMRTSAGPVVSTSLKHANIS